ncbi:unnamed protein product, partial [Trichogramma brassicae]
FEICPVRSSSSSSSGVGKILRAAAHPNCGNRACGMSAAADRKLARCRYNCLALYTFTPSSHIHALQFIECENENSMIIYIYEQLLTHRPDVVRNTGGGGGGQELRYCIDTKRIERHRYDVLALSYAYGIQRRLLRASRPATERERIGGEGKIAKRERKLADSKQVETGKPMQTRLECTYSTGSARGSKSGAESWFTITRSNYISHTRDALRGSARRPTGRRDGAFAKTAASTPETIPLPRYIRISCVERVPTALMTAAYCLLRALLYKLSTGASSSDRQIISTRKSMSFMECDNDETRGKRVNTVIILLIESQLLICGKVKQVMGYCYDRVHINGPCEQFSRTRSNSKRRERVRISKMLAESFVPTRSLSKHPRASFFTPCGCDPNPMRVVVLNQRRRMRYSGCCRPRLRMLLSCVRDTVSPEMGLNPGDSESRAIIRVHRD